MSKVRLELKGKNGQVYVSDDGSVLIGRKGWFGFLYQLFSQGCLEFSLGELTNVVVKKMGLMRGYLRLEGKQGNAVVWLTKPDMEEDAIAIKDYLETRMEARKLKQAQA